MPLKTYDESISVLRRSLHAAKLGDPEKMDGFKRLDGFVRTIEARAEPIADLPAVIARENEISASLGGRSVFDDRKFMARRGQLSLFPK